MSLGEKKSMDKFFPAKFLGTPKRVASSLNSNQAPNQVFHKTDPELTKMLQVMMKKLSSIESRQESQERKMEKIGSNSLITIEQAIWTENSVASINYVVMLIF